MNVFQPFTKRVLVDRAKKMPIQKVTQETVIAAAKALVDQGQEPTLARVRAYLGNCGSQTTLHKYLKKWKQACLKSSLYPAGEGSASISILEEKRTLEQRLQQQSLQSEQYAKELIQAEKSLMAYKLENQALKKENNQLQSELKEALALQNHFESLCGTIQEEREAFYNKELGEKNRLILLLQEELKAINLQALTEIREMGYNRDDAIMQEKVKIINLQEKIIKITEENKASLVELNKIKGAYQKLLRQCNQYQRIVQENVPEEVQKRYRAEGENTDLNQKGML